MKFISRTIATLTGRGLCWMGLTVFTVSGAAAPLRAQEVSGPGMPAAAQPAQPTLADILAAMQKMQKELDDSHRQVENLQHQVSDLRAQIGSGKNADETAEKLNDAVDELRDNQEMLKSEVKTLNQAKVETASKYSLTLSGMVLFNSFVVDGAVDNPTLPIIALPRNGGYVHHSIGASIQQTQFGFFANGPEVWGAQTSAEGTADFFGQPNYTTVTQNNGTNLRLRTADMNLDWHSTNVSAGLETPLITPLSPTSYATVGEPSLAWAGNLWTWLPQIKIEHRMPVSGQSHVAVAFGLIDPTTWNYINQQTYGIQRTSLQPGYEARAAYEWGNTDHPYELGVNGYYTKQRYSYTAAMNPETRDLDFWNTGADWKLPLAPILTLSGEFYRGRGIGDLGGGAFKDVVIDSDENYAYGLDAIGGWSQLKLRLNNLTELNAFWGVDNANSSQVRNSADLATTTPTPYLYLTRNRAVGSNIVFRPKTYLLFSGEYRNLRSWYSAGPYDSAQTFTLTMGYIF